MFLHSRRAFRGTTIVLLSLSLPFFFGLKFSYRFIFPFASQANDSPSELALIVLLTMPSKNIRRSQLAVAPLISASLMSHQDGPIGFVTAGGNWWGPSALSGEQERLLDGAARRCVVQWRPCQRLRLHEVRWRGFRVVPTTVTDRRRYNGNP